LAHRPGPTSHPAVALAFPAWRRYGRGNVPGGKFNRRIEDGDLVLWRPGITLFVAIWNNDQAESIADRFAWLREDMNPESFDTIEEDLGDRRRFAYRLREDSDDEHVPALYAFTVAADSHVQLAVYFDAEQDLQIALELWRSVACA
jgi:hypothetical protein